MGESRVTDLVLTMGIRFWRTAVDILEIRDLHHCEEVLADLCNLLRIRLKPFDLNTDSSLVLSLGVSFWMATVKDQKIRDVTHCDTIISYLQGFLDAIDQVEDVPDNVPDIYVTTKESPKVIKFTRKDVDMLKKEPEEKSITSFDMNVAVVNGYNIDNDLQSPDHFDDYYKDNDYDGDWESPKQSQSPSTHFQMVKSDEISVKEQFKKEDKTKKSESKKYPYKKKVVFCDYCGLKFNTAFRAGEHIDEFHPDKKEEFDKKYLVYECVKPGCKKVFYIQTSLTKHYRKFHKDFKQAASKNILKPEKAVAKCDECNRHFHILSNYEDHIEEHKHGLGTKLFGCDVCKAKFHFRTKLEIHKRKHDQLSLICPDCGISLPSKKKMYRHLEKHREEKRVALIDKPKEKECTICNIMVPHNTYQRHMYKVHDRMAEFCDICGKKCFSRAQLERHQMAVHKKEKTFCCNICGKKFALDIYLERHMDSQHSDKFRYKCDTCGKGFMVKQTYEGHVNMHLGLKPHKCQHCGAAYQNQSNLLAHIRKSCKQIFDEKNL